MTFEFSLKVERQRAVGTAETFFPMYHELMIKLFMSGLEHLVSFHASFEGASIWLEIPEDVLLPGIIAFDAGDCEAIRAFERCFILGFPREWRD
jgi:hypothetical protein